MAVCDGDRVTVGDLSVASLIPSDELHAFTASAAHSARAEAVTFRKRAVELRARRFTVPPRRRGVA
ncbi:hypothetical protein B6E66_13850 [Streptomyces maremycinicus]|nr:hypothetical protein B6E66_13850 [Streptomyces sp. B9173]